MRVLNIGSGVWYHFFFNTVQRRWWIWSTSTPQTLAKTFGWWSAGSRVRNWSSSSSSTSKLASFSAAASFQSILELRKKDYCWLSHSLRSTTFWCRVGASRSLLGSMAEEAAISGTWELLKTEDQLFTPVNREGLLLRGEVTGFLVVCNFCWSNIFSIQASWRGWDLSHRLNKILQQQEKITLGNGRLIICGVF